MTSLRGPSLTLRLTLLFALASACVLFLLGLLIGHAVERHFQELDMEILNGRMQSAKRALEMKPAGWSTAMFDDLSAGQGGAVVAVYGPGGETLYAGKPMRFPPVLLLADTTSGQKPPIKWTDGGGVPWRGISTVVQGSAAGAAASSVRVVVATEITHHEHFMTSFRQTLWSFMGMATLAMGLLGWIAVRRGLAPLESIRHQAAEITAHRLYTRLPVEAIPVELAELVETLNGMLSRLEKSFQRLSDFSSDLAHELRTPVSNLLTQTQVTLSKARTADEYREILASNAEEFERLSRTISDMLFLAKADNKQIIPHPEPIGLAEELGDLLAYYGVLAEEKAITLSLSGQGQLLGDRLMLRRAVSNLLSNALRHTPRGGRVTVLIDEGDEGMIHIAVENTGDDIPAEHLPRLFDRFYRVDGSRQRTTESSGLGLAITRSIVSAHGGKVDVASGEGVTRFTLSFVQPGS